MSATPEAQTIVLPQSEGMQQALFGYIVDDEHVYETVRSAFAVVKFGGWLNPYLTMLWSGIENYISNHGRYPSRAELENAPEVLNEESKMRERLLRELDLALKARASFGLEPIIQDQLQNWQRTVLIERQITEMSRKFNAGDISAAVDIIDKLSRRLETLTLDSDSLVSSADRLSTEMSERVSADRRMRFGISYLDDALGGISPKDLVVLGARTGNGKTQLITNIARSNPGKRIALFALEAEKTEIERRAKYGEARAIAKSMGENLEGVDFDAWVSLQAPQLDKYDAAATAATQETLAGLRTYYRTSGDFGTEVMERMLVAAAKSSDLIVLDHLHYVDLDGSKNENQELARIVKRIRDIALGYGVPIVVVAHLRKRTGNSTRQLVPEIDDLHGSSEISKNATSVITFGPIDVVTGEAHPPEGRPTIFRVAKHRREGSRVWFSGIAFFDANTGGYNERYAIGKLKSGDTDWEMLDPEKRPHWARRNGTVFISSIE